MNSKVGAKNVQNLFYMGSLKDEEPSSNLI